MQKPKLKFLKNKTIHIGYIGFNSCDEMKNNLLIHPLFENQKFKVFEEQELTGLLHKLKDDQYDYIIIPSKNKRNEINDMFLSLISRLDIEQINEIGMLICDINYYDSASTYDETSTIKEKPIDSFKGKKRIRTYHISKDASENKQIESIEYRIFKRNEYKTNIFTRFGIWLLKRMVLRGF